MVFRGDTQVFTGSPVFKSVTLNTGGKVSLAVASLTFQVRDKMFVFTPEVWLDTAACYRALPAQLTLIGSLQPLPTG